MRTHSTLIVALALTAAVSAQDRSAPRTGVTDAQVMRRMDLEARAFELRPRRRDTPLRYVNLSDNEMREIQTVSQDHMSKTVLNVSPVVEGCPCEEGPECTDQVYVVMLASEKAVGLQLSRVKKVWKVGVVQRWWLRYDALREQMPQMDYRQYVRTESELYREFPICVGELVPAAKTAAVPTVEGKK